jgi:hypothetical protein
MCEPTGFITHKIIIFIFTAIKCINLKMWGGQNGASTSTLTRKAEFSLCVSVTLLSEVGTRSMLAGRLLTQRECFSRTITNERINAYWEVAWAMVLPNITLRPTGHIWTSYIKLCVVCNKLHRVNCDLTKKVTFLASVYSTQRYEYISL